ncbi:MAG TPA: hypothetical protein VF384_04735 [Planctomycetota bacterium]
MLKVAIAVVTALVLGSVAFVVRHEQQKPRRLKAPVAGEAEEVATITTGERVDLDAHVPRTGLTIVEFTAAF